MVWSHSCGTEKESMSKDSVLSVNVPGYEVELLAFVADGTSFPEIPIESLSPWRQDFVQRGHLRRYIDQLRELYTGGGVTGDYLACPVCPMEICGVALAEMDAEHAEHIVLHVSEYLRSRTQEAA